MNKPFKFRYVNELAGTFVLVAVAALLAGIILAGRAQGWFEPVHTVRLQFPAEGSLGLQPGAEVQILGTTVGQLRRIDVEDDGLMAGELVIKGDFFQFVRADSRAVVKKKFGIAGDAFVEITQGTGAALPEDAELQATKDTELIEIAQNILKQIEEATVPAIREYTALAADLRNAEGPLMKLLSNLESLSGGLQRGEGSVGQLLRDPKAAQEVESILCKVNDALAQVNKVLADVKAATVQLPPMAARVGDEVEDLPGLVAQTQVTLREAERLVEGIQQHWLIRKHVPPLPGTEMVPSARVSVP